MQVMVRVVATPLDGILARLSDHLCVGGPGADEDTRACCSTPRSTTLGPMSASSFTTGSCLRARLADCRDEKGLEHHLSCTVVSLPSPNCSKAA